MSGHTFSIALIVVESVSIVFLAFSHVLHDDDEPEPLYLRIGYIGVMFGLAIHVVGQLDLLQHYRPPRTWAWVPLQLSVNWVIWARYLRKAVPRWRKALRG